MASFKDLKNNVWKVELVYANTVKVEERLGIDLFKLVVNPDGLANLWTNRRMSTEIVFVLIEDQLNQCGKTIAEIGDSFDGTTIDAAAEALEVALSDFSRKSNPLLKRTFDRLNDWKTEQFQKAAKKLEEMNLDEILEKSKAQKNTVSGLSEQSGNVQAS